MFCWQLISLFKWKSFTFRKCPSCFIYHMQVVNFFRNVFRNVLVNVCWTVQQKKGSGALWWTNVKRSCWPRGINGYPYIIGQLRQRSFSVAVRERTGSKDVKWQQNPCRSLPAHTRFLPALLSHNLVFFWIILNKVFLASVVEESWLLMIRRSADYQVMKCITETALK